MLGIKQIDLAILSLWLETFFSLAQLWVLRPSQPHLRGEIGTKGWGKRAGAVGLLLIKWAAQGCSLPGFALCAPRKSQSWGRQVEMRGSREGMQSSSTPAGWGRMSAGQEGAEGRVWSWRGGERMGSCIQCWICCSWSCPMLWAACAMCSSCQLLQDLVAVATSQRGTRGQSRSPVGKRCFSSLTGFGDIKEDQYKPFEVRLSS